MANQFLGKPSFSAGLGTHTGHVNLQKSRKNERSKASKVLLPVAAPLPVKHRCGAGVSAPSAAGVCALAAHHGTAGARLRPDEGWGPRQETLLWRSAGGCSFEQPGVSVVRHQLSSSLKPSRPVQHRWEPSSPWQLRGSRERRGTRGSSAWKVSWWQRGWQEAERGTQFSCFPPRSFFIRSLMTSHTPAGILIGCFNSKCPHLPSLLPFSHHFLAL